MSFITFTVLIALFSASCTHLASPGHSDAIKESSPVPLPRIGIRKTEAKWEFYSKASGKRFIPRGVNWVHLNRADDKKADNISFHASYFESKAAAIENELKKISDYGFNIVRVRLDAKGISDPKARVGALNQDYIDNLVRFIALCNRYRLYVQLTGQWLPDNYYGLAYSGKFGQDPANAEDINLLLMSEGHASAYGKYLSDVIKAISKKEPRLSTTVFSIDFWNELYFAAHKMPFSLAAGPFSFAGTRFDLSNPASRQELADKTTLSWVETVNKMVKSADVDVLTTSSVFSPKEVTRQAYNGVYLKGARNGDFRQPFRLTTLEKSCLDFLQVHPYPHHTQNELKSNLESWEFAELKKTKPILIGEFGAYKKEFKTVDDAATALVNLLDDACHAGIVGWLFWTWDTSEQTDLWNLKEHGEALARKLSPHTYRWCDSQ